MQSVAFAIGAVCLGIGAVLLGHAVVGGLPMAIVAGLALAALGLVGVGYGLGRSGRRRGGQDKPQL